MSTMQSIKTVSTTCQRALFIVVVRAPLRWGPSRRATPLPFGRRQSQRSRHVPGMKHRTVYQLQHPLYKAFKPCQQHANQQSYKSCRSINCNSEAKVCLLGSLTPSWFMPHCSVHQARASGHSLWRLLTCSRGPQNPQASRPLARASSAAGIPQRQLRRV